MIDETVVGGGGGAGTAGGGGAELLPPPPQPWIMNARITNSKPSRDVLQADFKAIRHGRKSDCSVDALGSEK